MVQGALASGEKADSIRQELTTCRTAGEAELRRRREQRNRCYFLQRTLLDLLCRRHSIFGSCRAENFVTPCRRC